MHLFCRANDGIDRTSLYAERAADAAVFVDDSEQARPFGAIGGVDRNNRLVEQPRQARNPIGPSGWTLVIASLSRRNRFGIGAARGIAAFRALGLR